MPTQANQKQAFRFLSKHFESGKPFTRADLQRETDWTKSSIDTYWAKQFKPFVLAVPPIQTHRTARQQRYRVSDAFRAYAKWEKFREHVTQVRRFTSSDYSYVSREHVLIYEFYMPLTNEGALRTTLDALFYKNTLLARLRALDTAQREEHFRRRRREKDDAYVRRLGKWLAKKFIGYSISHVSGRFRAEVLSTMQEAAGLEAKGARYLIDETTAVTRFIFPCQDEEEATAIGWFFFRLLSQKCDYPTGRSPQPCQMAVM